MFAAATGFVLLGGVAGFLLARWIERRGRAERDARQAADLRNIKKELEQRRGSSRSLEERLQSLVKNKELENKRLQEQLASVEREARHQKAALHTQLEEARRGGSDTDPGGGTVTLQARLRDQEELTEKFRSALLLQEKALMTRENAWAAERRRLVDMGAAAHEKDRAAKAAVATLEESLREAQRGEREGASRVRALEKLAREFQERLAEREERVRSLEEHITGSLSLLTLERERVATQEWGDSGDRTLAAYLRGSESDAADEPGEDAATAEPLAAVDWGTQSIDTAALLAEHAERTGATSAVAVADDLSLLPGIGPAGVKKLTAAGVASFAAVAAREGAELATILGLRGKKRDAFLAASVPAAARRLAESPPAPPPLKTKGKRAGKKKS